MSTFSQYIFFAKLGNYGIRTIGDIAQTAPDFLKKLLGVNGLALWRYANGTDQSRVMHRDFVSPVKSIGHGITCVADLEDVEEVWKVILALSQDIGHRLRVHELSARGVQVAVRGNDLLGAQFQCKLPCKTQLPSEIGAAAFRLFHERYRWSSKVRAVTVRAIDLVPHSAPDQLSIFVDAAQMKREVVPEDREDKGKAALTALFQSVHNENTPVIVERIVSDIDGIVIIVRFDGWQNVPTGRKMISRNLRDVIMRKYRIKDKEVFDKAYSYVEQYY